MKTRSVSRREFVGKSLMGVAAAGLASKAARQAMSASPGEPVTVGLIGAGLRGFDQLENLLAVGANVPVVCDLYDGHLARAREIRADIRTTRDYREVLDRKEIEAVLIATSDHWHAPIAIEAMRAGKDVYCEKPMTHTIPEALDVVKVSQETGRLVQVGSQSLSMQSTAKGKEWLEGGEIGNVYMVECSIFRPDPIGAWRYPIPADASPQTIDWERYLGDAPKRPFDAARFFQFRNWWDYGTGIAGDEYVHLLSRVHFLLNVQYPVSATAYGGLYYWTGDREVPDIHNTLYDYGKFQVVVMANLVSDWSGGEIVRFMGDKGTILLTEEDVTLLPYDLLWEYRYPIETWAKDQRDVFMAAHKNDPLADIGTGWKRPKRPKQKLTQRAEGTKDHIHNFLECVRTRQQPIEPVEFGCGTAVACHMTNMSYRQKKTIVWDAEKREATVES